MTFKIEIKKLADEFESLIKNNEMHDEKTQKELSKLQKRAFELEKKILDEELQIMVVDMKMINEVEVGSKTV